MVGLPPHPGADGGNSGIGAPQGIGKGQKGYEGEGEREGVIYGSEYGISGNKKLQNWELWGKSFLAEERYYEDTNLMWDKPDGDAEDNSDSQETPLQ